jgi:glutathione synthase/RimK-type ligase-like ATP-grasp enzyme
MEKISSPTPSKILIIGRDFHPDGKETAALIAQSLAPVLASKGAKVELLLFKDMLFDIGNESIHIQNAKTGEDIADFDAVLMTNWFSHASVRKDIAHTIALYLNKHDVPLLNGEALHSRSTSKLSQMMLAALNGVSIPRTIFSLRLQHLEHYLQEAKLGLPFVFKDAQASRGASNYLLNDIGEIADHAENHSERSPFMAQEYIASDKSDFRFFVAGGKIQLVIKRTGSSESHLHNTSQGAQTKLVPVTEFSKEVVDMVTAMSKLLHREVTGIDIMFDVKTDKPYFLEANPIPQIATGSNVDAKLRALADALLEAAESK